MTASVDKSIGATLRERRLELGISLDEVVSRTRIRKSYLEALEVEQFDAFPGHTYLKGYLKGYAEYLNLDPQPLLRSLAWAQAPAPSPVAPEPEPRPIRSPWPRHGLALLGGVVILLVLGWWVVGRQSAPPGPESPSSAAVSHDQSPPPPIAGQAPPGPIEPVDQMQQTVTTTAPPPATGATEVNSDSLSVTPSSPISAGTAVSPAPQAAAPIDPSVALGTAGVLRLQASGPSRLEVTIDGRPAQRYSLQANTILSWKVTSTVRIYLENPGNVRLWLGAREVDPAGRNQIVLQSAEELSR